MNELPLSNFIEECLLVAENNGLADNNRPLQVTQKTQQQQYKFVSYEMRDDALFL